MILTLGSSMELIRVTAEYSNAVLVAVLPYVSNAVHRLDLPVQYPAAPQNVIECSILPSRRPGSLGVEIGIKGDWYFVFEHGYIRTIQGPRDYFTLQDPDRIPTFYGKPKISAGQAIRLARNAISDLGISLESVFAEQQPRVTGPVKIGTNTVPHYHIQWLDPRQDTAPAVDIDANGQTERVEAIRFGYNKNLERPPPKIAVVPPHERTPLIGPSVNAVYAWKLVPIVLKTIDEYGKALGLPIPRPLTTNDVWRFSLSDNGGWPHSELELTNGWRFIYRNSMVNGYYAPDNLFNSDNRPILIKQFTGTWNLTESQAIELVRRTVTKLHYPTNLVHMDFKPQVQKPALPGIPRYSICWRFENEAHDDLQSKVEAEVDAGKGEVKSLYYDDKAYWNHPPPIDVPISIPALHQTNAVGRPASSRPQLQPNALPKYFKVLPGTPPH